MHNTIAVTLSSRPRLCELSPDSLMQGCSLAAHSLQLPHSLPVGQPNRVTFWFAAATVSLLARIQTNQRRCFDCRLAYSASRSLVCWHRPLPFCAALACTDTAGHAAACHEVWTEAGCQQSGFVQQAKHTCTNAFLIASCMYLPMWAFQAFICCLSETPQKIASSLLRH